MIPNSSRVGAIAISSGHIVGHMLSPLPFSAFAISSRIAGSSIVAGMVQGSPSAIFFMVPRRILPDRVFGSRAIEAMLSWH